MSFGGDLSSGAQGALRATPPGRTCHIILKFLAGSMLELVGNPQSYDAPESSGADFGVNKPQ